MKTLTIKELKGMDSETLREYAFSILLSDSHGQYIPKLFVEGFDLKKWGLKKGDWNVKQCADPENESYWDAWIEICDSVEFTDENGDKHSLFQSGDLFGVNDSLIERWIEANDGAELPEDFYPYS